MGNMTAIKRFEPMSVAKLAGLTYLVFGLIVGGLFAIFSLVGAGVGAAATGSKQPFIGLLFGVGAVIFFPLLYGLIGFLGGLIGAAIYNAVAGWTGGIQVELG
jgi:hypothetical protein